MNFNFFDQKYDELWLFLLQITICNIFAKNYSLKSFLKLIFPGISVISHFIAETVYKSVVIACRGTPGTSGEYSPHDFLAVRQTVWIPRAVVVIWRVMLKWSTAQAAIFKNTVWKRQRKKKKNLTRKYLKPLIYLIESSPALPNLVRLSL